MRHCKNKADREEHTLGARLGNVDMGRQREGRVAQGGRCAFQDATDASMVCD